MKVVLKALIGLGLAGILLSWRFSNPAKAPKGQQTQPTTPPTQLVTQSKNPAAKTETPMITDFTNEQEAQQWRSVDDVVMGGISQSQFSVTPEGIGVFSGELSLENNGGFTSVRRDIDDVDFAGTQAILLRVKGDGRPYQLRLQTETTNNSISYRAEFETKAGEWIEIELPIDAFEPVFRGRVIEDAPAINPTEIKQIGFLLADKQPGSFRLETDWIKTKQA